MDEHKKADEIAPRYYWVLFVKSKTLWQKFFYGIYHHVALLKNDGINWILIDPRPTNLHVDILPFESTTKIATVAKHFADSMTLIKVYALFPNKKFKLKKLLFPRFFNCVRAIKYVLGMKITGFSPSSFYADLIRKGEEDQSTSNIVVDSQSTYEYRRN